METPLRRIGLAVTAAAMLAACSGNAGSQGDGGGSGGRLDTTGAGASGAARATSASSTTSSASRAASSSSMGSGGGSAVTATSSTTSTASVTTTSSGVGGGFTSGAGATVAGSGSGGGDGLTVNWMSACWEVYMGQRYQAMEYQYSGVTQVPIEATLFFDTTCDPSDGTDNLNDTGQDSPFGPWLEWFIHHPDEPSTSAVWSLGNHTSGCVDYSTAPDCQ